MSSYFYLLLFDTHFNYEYEIKNIHNALSDKTVHSMKLNVACFSKDVPN